MSYAMFQHNMKQKTKTWLEMAQSDMAFAEDIIKNKNRPHYAIHFCHQALEKILKAIIQEHTNEFPKRTHNFRTLWEQGNIPLSEEQKLKLLDIMPHYIGSKNPEDIKVLHQTYTLNFVKKILGETKELFKWLENYLMSKRS